LAVFAYKARNKSGEILQDKIEGSDTAAVAMTLR